MKGKSLAVVIHHVFIVCIGLIALNISVAAEVSTNFPNAIELTDSLAKKSYCAFFREVSDGRFHNVLPGCVSEGISDDPSLPELLQSP
ncbi:MAG: hypothetical protein JSV40_01275 [Deltaproteobacteria bacterium]|nr:MAG: hypothetical protein JSV40_01275 [Deltaproteobacteria bacterium]